MQKNRINFLYVLPNLFTAGSIFLGILSIINASKGNFEKAAWLIVISSIFDALDGRVARLTHTTSKFGEEFDSLADVIAFGVAPSFLLYFVYANVFGKFGVLIVALYVIFGAVRLARFNVINVNTEPNVFIGLPIPASAMFVVGWILVFEEYHILKTYSVLLLLATLLAGVMMVSNVRYPSFKKIDLKRANFVKGLVGLIVFFSLLYVYPIEFLTLTISAYLFFGVGRFLYAVIRRGNIVRQRLKKQRKKKY